MAKHRIPWPQLGWVPQNPAQAPAFEQGPVSFLVVAPWCPDCQEIAPGLPRELPEGRPAWLVGEFAPPAEIEAFAHRHGIRWPLLFGWGEKSEVARNQARFRQIREACGDHRRWGVPLWIDDRIVNGWLEVDSILTFPAES